MCSTCGCRKAESFQAPFTPGDEYCVACGKDELAMKSNLCKGCQESMGIKKISARRLAELGWNAEGDEMNAETTIAQEYSETIDDIEDLEEQVKKTIAPKRKPTKYLREAKGSVMDSWKQMRKDGFRKEMYDQYIKDAETFGSENGGAGHLVCTECRTSHDIRDTDGWLIYGAGTGMKEILCPECGYGEGAGYLVCTIEGCYKSGDINTDGWYIGSLGKNPTVYCPTHGREEYPEYYDDDYNAESFESEWVIEAVQQNLNDKDFVNYAYKVLIGGDAKTFEEKSMAIAETMNQNANNDDFTSFVESELFNAEESSKGLPWMTFAFIGLGAFVASRIKTIGFKADGDCGCGCSGKSDCGDEKKADEGHYPNTYDPVQDFLPRYRYPEDSDWSNSYNPADPYRPLDYQTVQTDSRTTADRM